MVHAEVFGNTSHCVTRKWSYVDTIIMAIVASKVVLKVMWIVVDKKYHVVDLWTSSNVQSVIAK